MIIEKDIFNAFSEVISEKDKVVVIYSGIFSFISKINFKTKNIPETILDIIERVVTKKRTLILPSFSSSSFLNDYKFDIKKTIDNIGLIPKFALQTKKYYRTLQPLHSYLIFGKKTEDIKNLKFTTSWGNESILQFMSSNNARICTLGLPWNQGCAYLHRFEEIYRVPWRYFKIYKGCLFDNDVFKGMCSENKYSSPLNGKLKYDFKPFIPFIKKSKSYKKSSNKNFILESINAKCLNTIGNKIFQKDPWVIVKNKNVINKWILEKKNKEIGILNN